MSDRWNYQPNRAPHHDHPYKEWSYNGYTQPPPDFFNHNNFGVPVPFMGRGAPMANHQGQMQHCGGQVPRFPLNPNAAAFVPRGGGYQRSYQSGPVAMSYYSCDADAEIRAYESTYNQFTNEGALEEYIPSQQLHHDMVHSDNLVSLQEIQVGLEQILSDTDDFDSWAGAIRDRMVEKRMSAPTREVAVHMILEMAVSVAPRPLSGNNPQHTLARLLNFLCSEIPCLLRDAVLKSFCEFHSKRSSFLPEQRINLCIFFAEAYEKMETESGKRIDKVGEALLEQLDDLFKLDMNDNLMKTIIQLVKLCGRHLDASPDTEPRVSQLLTKLLAFGKGHPQLSESVKSQIMHVAELRKSSWGANIRESGTSSHAIPSSSTLSVPNSENGVIIGEDGAVLELNEEERSFLESQFNAMDGLEDSEQDQSFDEQEVMKDFGDFVKEEEELKTTSMLEKLKVCDADI